MRSKANAALRRVLRRPRGFTLVEVAASVAILGGVILGILVARNRALTAHAEADQILACTRLCAAQVAALRAGFASEGEGKFVTPSGKYEWRITAFALPKDAASTDLTAYLVTVRPAPLPRDSATGDPASSQDDEQPDEPGLASAILWLPAKPAPAKETP
jgi:type II secretory pathway pseudopilin PulG